MLALLVGVAARDCILIASAGVLAIYVARIQAENGEAIDLLRSAIQCWVIGGTSVVIALALVAMVAAMHAGLWGGNRLDTSLMLATLGLSVAAVGIPALTVTTASQRRRTVAGHVTTGALVVSVAFIARSLDGSGPCMFALGVSVIAALSGWRLARTVGAELASSASRT